MNEPRTQFVRNRLKQTSWDNREYIEMLLVYERMTIDPPRNVGYRFVDQRHNLYPVELACIEDEVLRGKIITDKQFARRLEKHQQRKREEAEEAGRKMAEEFWSRQRELEQKREKWTKLGGKP